MHWILIFVHSFSFWRLKLIKKLIFTAHKMAKTAVFCTNPQNWFHVKSEWYKILKIPNCDLSKSKLWQISPLISLLSFLTAIQKSFEENKCEMTIWRIFWAFFSQKIPQKSWLTGQNRNPRPIWLPPFCQMMKQIITIQTFWWTKTDQILSKCTIAHYQRLSSSEYSI